MATHSTVIQTALQVDNKQANAAIDNTKKRVDALNKAAASTKVGGSFAASKAAAAADDMSEYRIARGARGTGAEGRDFARQAQGLGGLVHVYATFAANLFAVSAAFNALKRAADTTNMVEGLNQLGAASGQNLGSMAKNVALLTDNAVTLRDAMAATAQATSAGMSGEQLNKMTLIAKKASQALGRDMSDSLSRISRGITKLEPELLDEIGLFVRVDKAAANYARTIGKTTTSLTDFERRQAFAIATLEQGEKKFGQINIDANPFSKLEASFINLATKGGELLNTVLGPIAKLLAESPVALATAMAGMATMLLSKAIPAMQGWRDNIRLAAEEAEKLASSKVQKAIDIKTAPARVAREKAERLADEELGYQDKLLKELEKRKGLSLENIRNKDRELIKELIVKAPSTITDKELEVLDKAALKSRKYKAELMELSDSLHYSRRLEIEAAKAIEEHAIALERAIKGASRFSMQGMNLAEAQKLQKKSQGMGVVSASVDQFSSMGWVAGWAEYDKKMEESKESMKKLNHSFGILDHGILRVKTGLGMAAVAASKFVNAFGFIGVVISSVTALYMMIDSVLSKNSKQIEEFNMSIDSSKSSLDGLNRTIADISTKSPFDKLSVESIQAKATAINEISTSISNLVKSLSEVDKYATEWDKFWDFNKKLIGTDLRSKATKNLSVNISEIFTNSLDSEALKTFKDSVSSMLSTTDFSESGISKALDSIKDKDKFLQIAKEITKAEEKYSKSLMNTASNLTSYKDSVIATEKAMQDLSNSFIPNDNLSKFGTAQINQANKLAEALKSPEHALVALSDAVSDFNNLKLFPPEIAQNLLQYKDSLINIRETVGGLDDQIIASKQRLATAEAETKNAKTSSGQVEARFKVWDEENLQKALEKAKASQLKELGSIQKDLQNTSIKLYESGAEKVGQSIKIAMQEGALSVQKNLASGIEGLAGIQINSELKQKEFTLQEQTLRSQAALIIETQKLRLAFEEQNLLDKLDKETNPDVVRQTQLSLLSVGRQQKALEGKSYKDIYNNIRNGSDDIKLGLNSTADQIAGIITQQSKVSSQRQAEKDTLTLNSIKEIWKVEQERIQGQIDLAKLKADELSTAYRASGIYDENLEQKLEENRLNLRALEAKKEEAVWAQKISDLTARKNIAGEKSEVGKKADEAIKALNDARAKQQETDKERFRQEDKKATAEKIQQLENVEKRRLDYSQKYLDIQSDIVDILEQGGIYTKYQTEQLKSDLAISKLKVQQESELLSLRNKRDNTQDSVIKAGLTAQIKEQEAYNLLVIEAKKSQDAVTLAILRTEETLRNAERQGSFGKEYFDTVAQDFKDKVIETAKAAASAASVLTKGIMDALDNTIDNFFELMQKGELTFKSIINTLRQGLSDAFRDAASQTLKNAWKDIFRNMGIESTQEKAAREVNTNMQALVVSLDRLNNTIANGANQLKAPESYKEGRTVSDVAKEFNIKSDSEQAKMLAEQEGIVLQEKINTETFGRSLEKFMTGQMSIFQFATNSLRSIFNWLVPSLASVLGGSSSSSGGLFSGIFGSVLKAAVGSITGTGVGLGDVFSTASTYGTNLFSEQTMRLAEDAAFFAVRSAKGNSFRDGTTLQPNSIVTSPTLFAFAKGGVFPNRGVAGEAGPEAVVPLKRDAQGNLGIRGGSGDTNISISINMETGNSEAKTSGQQKPNAEQFAKNITNMIQAEMVKQKRPGGLLYGV